jgi:hypothetical protein
VELPGDAEKRRIDDDAYGNRDRRSYEQALVVVKVNLSRDIGFHSGLLCFVIFSAGKSPYHTKSIRNSLFWSFLAEAGDDRAARDVEHVVPPIALRTRTGRSQLAGAALDAGCAGPW